MVISSEAILIMLAIVLFSLAFVLWYGSNDKARKIAANRFLIAHIDRHDNNKFRYESKKSIKSRVWKSGPRNWKEFLLRAGLVPTTRFYVLYWLQVLLPTLLALFFISFIAGNVVFILMLIIVNLRIWIKVKDRRKKIVYQLPDFLDQVVRLMAIGNSMTSAFYRATQEVEQPLRVVMENTINLYQSGKEIDIALFRVSRQYGIRELYLVAAVIRVALKYGGRSDEILERIAGFMRDLEQAREDLKAMSSELRMSAWVLGLMPLGLAIFIFLTNNELFKNMWIDPSGQVLLLVALGLQLVGSFWLYRLAKSI